MELKIHMADDKQQKAREFYNQIYQGKSYGRDIGVEKHPFLGLLEKTLVTYDLTGKRCLEIGCGRGKFQHLVDDYTGVDISFTAGKFMVKPFVVCSACALPFPDNSFDVLWTYAVLEHIPDPEAALWEMRRVMKSGGLLILHAAWHAPFYAAQGLTVRPFCDLDIRARWLKLFAHIHRVPLYRAIDIVGLRCFIVVREFLGGHRLNLYYRRLEPNYNHWWMADSDAVVTLDQLETILWFRRKGDTCLSPAGWIQRFVQVDGTILFKICKRPDSAPARMV